MRVAVSFFLLFEFRVVFFYQREACLLFGEGALSVHQKAADAARVERAEILRRRFAVVTLGQFLKTSDDGVSFVAARHNIAQHDLLLPLHFVEGVFQPRLAGDYFRLFVASAHNVAFQAFYMFVDERRGGRGDHHRSVLRQRQRLLFAYRLFFDYYVPVVLLLRQNGLQAVGGLVDFYFLVVQVLYFLAQVVLLV